jgi:hypothetical protein
MNDSMKKAQKPAEKKVLYSARFVKENLGDRHIVAPKETFVKTWTFRNNGETVWPEGSLFIQTNGDDLQASSVFILQTVNPGEEVDVSMELTTPELPGKYCAFFRFVHGDNQRFGQKVWCDILVQQPEKVVVDERPSSLLDSVYEEVEPIR